MAVGQIIGRVAVKVLPDTSDFRRTAERELNAIEKTLKVEIPTTIDMTGAKREMLMAIREINAQNRTMDSRKIRFHSVLSTAGLQKSVRGINTQLELDNDSLKKVRRELEQWRNDVSPLKVLVRPEIAAGFMQSVQARLAFLGRPRTVQFIPTINPAAAAGVAATLAALSGARILTRTFDRLQNIFRSLDKNLPIIGSIALAAAGLSGWLLSAASNLAALSASLAQIGGIAFALPGIFGGMAFGIGATVAVLKDFNEVIPEVKTELSKLQDQMSEKFWEVAEAPIRRLVDTLLPQFRTGLVETSSLLGTFFGNLATSLSSRFDGILIPMFRDLSDSIKIAGTATDAYANTIAILGQVGASYLPRLAQWFVDISNQFNAFIDAASASGALKQWIDQGIQSLKDLGRVLHETGSIMAGIARAATAAGGSTLGTLADTLQRVANVVNGPVFQTQLIKVLEAAHEAMSRISTISGPAVKDFFLTLSNTLATVLPIAGQGIGLLLSALAQAKTAPEFASGLEMLFAGLRDAISALSPGLVALGPAIGSVLSILGQLAQAVGPSLNVAFQTLASVIQTLAPAVKPLIDVLGAALLSALQALAPVFVTLAQAVANLVTGGLIPALVAAFTTLLPVITQLAPILGNVLVTALNAIAPLLPMLVSAFASLAATIGGALVAVLPSVAQLLTVAGQAFADILKAVLPLLPVLLQLALSVLVPLIPVISQLAQSLLPMLAQIFAALVPVITPLLGVIQNLVNLLMPFLVPALQFVAEILASAITGAINGVILVFQGFINIVTGVWNILRGIFTGDWPKVWEGVKQVFQGVWEAIKGIILVAINVGILGVVKKGITALKAFWDNIWTAISTAAKTVWIGLRTAWTNFLTALRSAPSSALNAIKNLFSQAWTSITTGVRHAWTAIRSAVSTGIQNVVSFVRTLPGRIVSALGNLGSLLFNAGKSLLQGLARGIGSAFGAVKDKLGELTSKLTSWKGPPEKDRKILTPVGQLIIDGLIRGMESRFGDVRKSLFGLTSEISGTKVEAPQIGRVNAPNVSTRMADLMSGTATENARVLNYYAAPGSSLGSEEDLFAAAERARMGGW